MPIPDAPELKEEQLSRNRSFFLGGQTRIEGSFCIVVGVGGVGSHAAHMLARSGVGRLRLIDFDNVTLSSLNRHATATRGDVGTPKVVALAAALGRIVPSCVVEPMQCLLSQERCSELLGGSPDFVLDCIDDRDTKVALLLHCRAHNLPVLASLGAGGKADPTRLRFMDLALVPSGSMDPLGTAIKQSLRKAGLFAAQYREGGRKEGGASLSSPLPPPPSLSGITCLFSAEEPRVSLLPLPSTDAPPPAGEGASASPPASASAPHDHQPLGALDNFRVRIMPVLGTMPAVFGQAMAAFVLCKLAGEEHAISPMETTGHAQGSTLRLISQWNAWEGEHYPKGEGWGCTCGLSMEEVDFLVGEVWHARSAVSHLRLGVRGVKLQLIRWRPWGPTLPSNLVLLSDDEAAALASATEGEELWCTAREAVAGGWDFNRGEGGGQQQVEGVRGLEVQWERAARGAIGDGTFETISKRLAWCKEKWGY